LSAAEAELFMTSTEDRSIPTSFISRGTTAELQPLLFQCTYCLVQYSNKSEWVQHELSHFSRRGWPCMVNDRSHVSDCWSHCILCGNINQNSNSTQHNIDCCTKKSMSNRLSTSDFDKRNHLRTVHGYDHTETDLVQSWKWPQCMNEWYWYCGFCNTTLLSWDERKDHIADKHFKNGKTMSTWNSSTSPYPWSKLSSTPIRGFSRWEKSRLLDIQQSTLVDAINT
jgi:hypothetical protein